VGHGCRLPKLHDHTQDTPHSIGLLWMSDQRDAETSTHQHTTLIGDSHPCPRWDSNPQCQQADGCRRPRGQWDRHSNFTKTISTSNYCSQVKCNDSNSAVILTQGWLVVVCYVASPSCLIPINVIFFFLLYKEFCIVELMRFEEGSVILKSWNEHRSWLAVENQLHENTK
jgi:hypothetical protein